MGRSAKFLKKVKKPATSSGQRDSKPVVSQPAPSEQKKKAGLKAKAKATAKRREGAEGHVLGGADYVELLMGSRRKAREEAAKLPKDDD